MSNRDRLERFLRTKLRSAGRQVAEAQRAYSEAKAAALVDLPQDRDGRVPVVCRRYAEKRRVELDAGARPHCFEAGHRDCEGCAEDVREGTVETW